jgi:hypothetical protein
MREKREQQEGEERQHAREARTAYERAEAEAWFQDRFLKTLMEEGSLARQFLADSVGKALGITRHELQKDYEQKIAEL